MDLQTRVRRRVEELGQSPITLAKSVGLERGYINDIVIGRKRSVRTDKLELVAQALGVSVGYLQGMDDAVMILPEIQTNTINAICETGVWRTLSKPRSGRSSEGMRPGSLPARPLVAITMM